MSRSDCKEIWDSVRNFDQLKKAMVMFLKSLCTRNPWHLDTVDPETVPMLETLVKINQNGFVTIEGQPGTIKVASDYQELQRGYISGIILNKNVRKFVGKLLKTKQVVVYVEKLNSEINLFGDVTEDMYVPDKIDLISLTQEIGKSIRYYTNFPIPYLHGKTTLDMCNKKLAKFLSRRASFVEIIMKKQGDTNLDKIVLECLK